MDRAARSRNADAAEAPELEELVWHFALSFYRRPGVAQACLDLQEMLRADIDIVLLGLFAALERNLLLDASSYAELDALVKDWRREIVQPLRRIRTSLKSKPEASPATRELRERIKGEELEAEKIELAVLAGWLDQHAPRMAKVAEHVDIDICLDRIRTHFAGDHSDGLDDQAIGAALAILAGAAREHRIEKFHTNNSDIEDIQRSRHA
ncbi:TIGR02444 family protein [Rhodoligotrophos defluvii]|uniref:TIGR02444 family protein n=1 Tax=Rhodoligotrophos defluvii TaxID=2561934 RepID=UPI001EF0D153|nr:TIGR02444 family protein [Rhodoligotrophos defluvii]